MSVLNVWWDRKKLIKTSSIDFSHLFSQNVATFYVGTTANPRDYCHRVHIDRWKFSRRELNWLIKNVSHGQGVDILLIHFPLSLSHHLPLLRALQARKILWNDLLLLDWTLQWMRIWWQHNIESINFPFHDKMKQSKISFQRTIKCLGPPVILRSRNVDSWECQEIELLTPIEGKLMKTLIVAKAKQYFCISIAFELSYIVKFSTAKSNFLTFKFKNLPQLINTILS